MKYNLPRSYLSYSSWSLWKRDKQAFRRKYYFNEAPFETVETIFGKKIAKRLEDKDPELSFIPSYSKSEHGIETLIGDVPVKGYLDTFEPDTFSFAEFKTGHLSKNGKSPWDEVKVARHDQLPFYSLLIEAKYGKVDRVTYLHWIETAFKEKKIMFDGMELIADTRELQLTGRIETFKRIIPKWERDNIKESILLVAREISEDYSLFLKR
jgi:hypothetical protein